MMSQSCAFSVLSEIRSNKIILPSVEEIESELSEKSCQLTDFQKTGKYMEAEQCKENIEKLKKQLQDKKILDMAMKQKRERRKMEKTMEEELIQLNAFWTHKIQEFNSEGQKLIAEMESKHEAEKTAAKAEFESQISNKMRESAECLNLRKREEQMVKQQKYGEAHLIQQQISQMQKKEKEMFEKQRQAKVDTALSTLMAKQKTEKQALIKKTKASQCELQKDKEKEISRIKHKNENIMKELKSQQQKELLAQKGQIKSKVTVSAVKSRSKIVFNQTQ